MSEKNYTIDEIQEIAKSLIGKTFGELNNYQKNSKSYDKGTHGHILEQDVYHYDINSKSAADFEEAGVELKVTPYKRNKNGTLSAKERLVLNIINYMDEYKHTFYTSHFWEKNKLTQIVWYLNEDNKPKDEFVITNELLFSFPEDDLKIIKNDWETIIEKIKQGKAHELSEADTMYLGACTKGANSNSVRKQPFSDIMAKQRAFCLKTSYMTQLVRWYIDGKESEKISHNSDKFDSFENELETRLSPFKGKDVSTLCQQYNLNSKIKNVNELLVTRMLGVKGKLSQTDEFVKANIVPKTIRINSKGRIVESMSFPTFKFCEIINQEWENSDLYNYFETTKFMFAIFVERNGKCYFDGIKFWNMPQNVLDNEVKKVWEQTVEIIKSGKIVKGIKNNRRQTNFPSMNKNPVCHVRPHGRNANDTYPLPIADEKTGLTSYTKQCFWLNNGYVLKIINRMN